MKLINCISWAVLAGAVNSGLVFGADNSSTSSPLATDESTASATATAPGKAGTPAAPSEAVNAPAGSTRLHTVVVHGQAITPTQEAQHDLNQVVGGTNVISSSNLEKGKDGSISDALRNQPGIFVQSVNGGEATRLSLRGSGLIRAGFLFGFGNQLEIDGLRLYSTSGNPYEAIDPFFTDHVEVLRGSNGFNDGPLSLGGVINYVTKTGYDSSPLELHVEAGNYGYFRALVSSGLVEGPFDYYAAFDHWNQEGYRNNTHGDSYRATVNFGYQITPDILNRISVRYAEQNQDDAGYLTWAQFQANPKQSQFPQIRSRINPGTWIASDKTSYTLDADSTLETGLQYDNYPINGPGGPAATRFLFDDLSSLIRYKRSDLLFGDHQSNTIVSFVGYHQLNSEFDTFDINGKQTGRRPADQSDWSLIGENDLEAASKLWVTSGLSANYQTRSTNIAFSSNPGATGQSISREYFNVDPRLGLRYEITPNEQVYTNVTRSVDAPSSNSFIRTDANQVPLNVLNLQAATATTVEVGTRGTEGPFHWDVDYYHSWVDNELLTVPVTPGSTATITSNATPTQHQGVEASLDITLWQRHADPSDPKDILVADTTPEQVILHQVYNWNNFYFDGDPQFGKNTLPGVPSQIYEVSLEYDHPSGFYTSVDVESVLTKYAVDFANTFNAQPYAVLGATIGYEQPKKGWKVFIEGKNLTDQNYAPVVNTTFNAGGKDVAVFAPAPRINFSAGATYRF